RARDLKTPIRRTLYRARHPPRTREQTEHSMTLSRLIRKPLIAAVLGASMIGVPVGTLYLAGMTRALAAPATAAVTPQGSPAPAAGTPTVTLPEFSSMVQRYGPAVVNIQVVTKVQTSFNGQSDQGDDENGGGGDNGQGNPFGPNSPFAPFFRGMPFQNPSPPPVHREGSGFIIPPD